LGSNAPGASRGPRRAGSRARAAAGRPRPRPAGARSAAAAPRRLWRASRRPRASPARRSPAPRRAPGSAGPGAGYPSGARRAGGPPVQSHDRENHIAQQAQHEQRQLGNQNTKATLGKQARGCDAHAAAPSVPGCVQHQPTPTLITSRLCSSTMRGPPLTSSPGQRQAAEHRQTSRAGWRGARLLGAGQRLARVLRAARQAVLQLVRRAQQRVHLRTPWSLSSPLTLILNLPFLSAKH